MSSENTTIETLRSGFVVLAGPTNAGKSTLMNAIIGEKLAIITPKPQTTRNRILGIHTMSTRGQIIFVDTPGFHRSRGKLGHRMNDMARRSLDDTDIALLVVDASLDAEQAPGRLHPANASALDKVKQSGVPFIVALNKVDKIRLKDALLPVIQMYAERSGASDVIPISALNKDGLDRVQDLLLGMLPEGGFLYPPDVLSDQAERFLAAEIIREKVMMATRQELPYSVAVEVEQWEEHADGKKKKRPDDEERKADDTIRINAIIHVERDSQKGIVIGKGGSRLKEVGSQARVELESMFGTKVFLELFVRVEKDWTHDPKRLDRFGY